MKPFPPMPNAESASRERGCRLPIRANRLWHTPAIANRKSQIENAWAFSLVEILIAMSLMGFMVLGLMAMFSHTQRAFRVGMAQTDVLETGRATISLLAGELEQATPAGFGSVTNFAVNYYDNFYSTTPLPGTRPPGAPRERANVLEQVFFLVRENQKWHGLGYLVALPNQAVGSAKVGTLYRFQEPWSEGTNDPSSLSTNFMRVATNAIFNRADLVREINNNSNISTNLHRVADGIIHFRMVAYNLTNGLIVPPDPQWPTWPWRTNGILAYTNQLILPPEMTFTYAFTNNAVPAYVDLELGILESAAWERMKSLPDNDARLRYLQRQAGRIHVFRRHVAVHNVDPEAYR